MKVTPDMIDPQLRRAARVASFLTSSTPDGYMRQSAFVNLLMRRGLQPGPPKTRVKNDISTTTQWITRRDGTPLRILVSRPVVPRAGVAGVLWLHGGGYAIGTPELSRGNTNRLIAATDCVVVLPDYRLSVEAPYPAALHDCYDALLWLRDNASSLGVSSDQIMVGGESAGGGLTAAVTLLARDLGEVAVAFQMPLYPMIDDRVTDSGLDNDAPVWNAVTNSTAWELYLGSLSGGDVPAYAAPARATDLAGLPPTFTFVGDVEPFRDETVSYVTRLEAAGVPVHFRLYPGAFHGFDMVPSADISRDARAFMLDTFRYAVANYRAQQP